MEKILAVDDNPDNVELISQILEDNYDVLEAYSGSDCIELAKAQAPDLILLDVVMPEMDGFAVLKKLQKNKNTRNIPVILITAHSKKSRQIADGLEMGAFDYITKPIEDEVLLAKVKVAVRVKQAEDSIKKQNYELDKANRKLQELDHLKSMFIASMSHEVRTPLNSIIGFTGILLMGMSGELNKEQQKQLLIVKNNASHLLDLITDIIDVGKIEADKMDIYNEAIDLPSLIIEVKDALKQAASGKSIDIALNMPDQLTIKSDRRRLKQILVNLLGNAIKFTDKGKVIIHTTVKDKLIEVSVSDTGSGIPVEHMDKLFKAFSQIHGKEDMVEGTGLGLYLSRKIVELLGGSVWAQSELEKGSTFTFTLPYNREG